MSYASELIAKRLREKASGNLQGAQQVNTGTEPITRPTSYADVLARQTDPNYSRQTEAWQPVQAADSFAAYMAQKAGQVGNQNARVDVFAQPGFTTGLTTPATLEATRATPTAAENLRNHASSDITFRNQQRDAQTAAHKAHEDMISATGNHQAYKEAEERHNAALQDVKEAKNRVKANAGAEWMTEQQGKYTGLDRQADFAELSQPDEEKIKRFSTSLDFSAFGERTGSNKNLYYNINKTRLLNREHLKDGSLAPGDVGSYAFMTDDEAANYNYIYNKQGADAARSYYEYLKYDLDLRKQDARLGKWEDIAAEKPVAASAFSVATNLGSGAGIVSLAAQNAQRALTGSSAPINYNTGAFAPAKVTKTVRDTVTREIERKHPKATAGEVNVLSFLYQTGMSMADSAVIAGLGAVGLPAAELLLGGSAATQAALDAKERGASDREALFTGIAAGAAESVFEKVSLESLIKPGEVNGVKDVIHNVLKQSFTEGSEEFFTTLANTVTDAAINGDRSEINRSIEEYRAMVGADGQPIYTEAEAEKKAWNDWLTALLTDFLGGAVSGGIMGGGVASGVRFAAETNVRKTGKMLKSLQIDNETVKALVQADMEATQETANEDMQKFLGGLAQRLIDGEDLSGKLGDEELGRVYAIYQVEQAKQNTQNIPELLELVKLERQLGSGDSISNAKLGALFRGNLRAEAEAEFGRMARERQTEAPAAQETEAEKVAAESPMPETERAEEAAEAPAAEAEELTALNSAVKTILDGGSISGQTVRKIMEDADAMQILRDSKALTATVRPGADGRKTVSEAVQRYAEGKKDVTLRLREPKPAAEGREDTRLKLRPIQQTESAGESAPELAQRMTAGRPTAAEIKAVYDNADVVAQLREGGFLSEDHISNRDASAMWSALTEIAREGTENGETEAAGSRERQEDEDGAARERSRYGGFAQRKNRVGPGGSFAERTEQIREGWRRREAGGSLRDSLRNYGAGEVSTREAGISNGTEQKSLRIIPDYTDAQTEEKLRDFRQAQKVFKERGITVEGFTGTLILRDEDGRNYRARGYVSGDGSRILVRLDHPTLNWQEVLLHEDFHQRVKSDKALLRDTAQAFLREYGQEELNAIIADYAEAYGYVNEADYQYIAEEVLADYYAGIDVFAGSEDAQTDIRERSETAKKVVGNRGENAQSREESEGRYSFEGVLSKNPFLSQALEAAQRMEEAGNDAEKIFRSTGMFRGADGKWRHEISDDDLQIDTSGKWHKNKDVRRYHELQEELLNDSLSSDEAEELRALTRALDGVKKTPRTLDEMIKHKTLFKAYPELKKIRVGFLDLGPDTIGSYSPANDNGDRFIFLHKKLKRDQRMLKTTLIHEIQHAIQDIEGFSEGANVDMYQGMEAGDRTARDLYFNTAGEIEARNAAERSDIPGWKRRNIFPTIYADGGKDNTIFAENYTQALGKTSRETDWQYMDAVETGDMETAQKQVDRAAKRAGYRINAYHGTPINGITVFDAQKIGSHTDNGIFGSGFYFTTNMSTAESYAGENGETMPVKLKADSSFWMNRYHDKSEVAELLNMDESALTLRKSGLSTVVAPGGGQERQFTSHLISAGYDSIVVQHGKHDYEIVVFDPAQIKAADAVTYDEDGNVIPLSQRFDAGREDIRFSRDLPGETAELREENRQLREKLAWWEKQMTLTEHPEVRREDSDRLARRVLKRYSSKTKLDSIGDDVKALGDYLLRNDVRWTEAKDRALRIAHRILDNSQVLVEDGNRDFYRDLKSYFKGKKISFAGQEEMTDFEAWRKRNFGRFTIAKDGTPIDSLWEELQESFGKGYFPDDIINPTDMMLRVEELFDRFKETYENPYSADLAEAAEYVANDILDGLISSEVRQEPPTIADRKEKEFAKQLLTAEQRTEQVKKLLRQEKARRSEIVEERVRERTAKANKKFRENYMEKRKKTELRLRILKQSERLTQKVLKPTDKSHVPDKFRRTVAAVLASVNRESGYDLVYSRDGKYHAVKRGTELFAEPTGRTRAFRSVKDELKKISDNTVVDSEIFGEGDVPGLITTVIEDYADIPLTQMDSTQLDIVSRTLNAIEAAVNNYNKLLSESRFEYVSDIADALADENEDKRPPVEHIGVRGKLETLIRLDMLTPEAYFRRLGKSGETVFRIMRNAQDDFIRLTAKAAEDTQVILQGVDIRELEKDVHVVKIGEKHVQMTTAQLMELYLLMKREQAQNHIVEGGILIEPVKSGRKKITQTEPIRIQTLEELAHTLEPLTAEQMRLADRMQSYLSRDMAEVGNKASMAVYGYKKFGQEDYYWKIRSNNNELQSSVEKDTQTTSVANKGFTKATVPEANTSVLIGSVFDTFSQSVIDMNTYGAWLAATEDLNRIRNYTFYGKKIIDGIEKNVRVGTVNGILDRVFGTGGRNYLQNLLADIAVGTGAKDTAMTNDLVGNYKAAAIGANLRVIIQQPTAILRAMDMISPKYLAAGLKNPMKGFERAKQYAPIAQWKDWGYFDVNTGRQMKDVLFDTSDGMERLKQASMTLAGKADSFAWGQLWNAVEAETRDRTELEPGTKVFYESVAKRFTEIVDRTQVVDGILQRSQIMRSDNWLNKAATSFMGEPTKQFNMLMSAIYDYRSSRYADQKDKAKKALARTTAALLVSGILNAAAQSIMDAVRDDDKDLSWWEKWLRSFMGVDKNAEGFRAKLTSAANSNVGGTLNPLGYLPYVKDIWSIVQGYDVTRMDMDSISDTVTAAQRFMKSLRHDNSYTIAYSTEKLVEQCAKLLGIPAYNVARDLTAFANTFAQATDNYALEYAMARYVNTVPGSKKPNSSITQILYNAYLADNGSYEVVRRMMDRDGYDADSIDKALDSKWLTDIGWKAATEAEDKAGNNDGKVGVDEEWAAVPKLKLRDPKEKEYLIASIGTGDAAWKQYTAARDSGVSQDKILAARARLRDFDKDGNGNYKQEEIKAALDAQSGLTNKERAVLWQSFSSTTSAKNNPYDTAVGEAVLERKGTAPDKPRLWPLALRAPKK